MLHLKLVLPVVCLLIDLCATQYKEDPSCGLNIRLEQQNQTRFNTRIQLTISTDQDELGTWPWMTSSGRLDQDENWVHICGGIIISNRFVLTAAHCVGIGGLKLRIGDGNLQDSSDDIETKILTIQRTIIHPKYDIASDKAYYDIALWKVATEIQFNSYIRPICLPQRTDDFDEYADQQTTVMGWGASDRISEDHGLNIRAVPLRVFSQRYCNSSHSDNLNTRQKNQIQRSLPNLFTPHLMCAGYEQSGFGPCVGDSGGPLVKYVTEERHYELIGVVHGGIGTCGDSQFPALFAQTSSPEIYDFIIEAMEDKTTSQSQSLNLLCGNNAELGTWPWMVSAGWLNDDNEWIHVCGGVIISRRFVLTAAHCTGDDRLKLRMGDSNLKDSNDDVGVNMRNIKKTIIHPTFNKNEYNLYNNVALWEVEPVIEFSSYIRPICLPERSNDLGTGFDPRATFTGWGKTDKRSSDHGMQIKVVTLRVHSQRVCNYLFSKLLKETLNKQIIILMPELFTPIIMCAGNELPGIGPCKGDSGSPLVKLDHSTGQYELLGILLGGVGPCGDPKFPAIFARINVPAIYDFITGS